MKGYFINAEDRTIEMIDYEYRSMRNWLPGGITIAAQFETGDVIYVDDKALLTKATVAFRILRRDDGQPMMSNGIMTGPDNPEGEDTLPPRMSIAQLRREIQWLSLEDALKWFRDRHDQPAVASRFGHDPVIVHATWGDMLANLEGRSGGYDPMTSESIKKVITRI